MSLFSGIKIPRYIGLHDSGHAIFDSNARRVGVSGDAILASAPKLASFLGDEIEKSGHNPHFSHGLASDEDLEMLFDMPDLLSTVRNREKEVRSAFDTLGIDSLPINRYVSIDDSDIPGIRTACYYYQAAAREMIQACCGLSLGILQGQNEGLVYVVSRDGVNFMDCEISIK